MLFVKDLTLAQGVYILRKHNMSRIQPDFMFYVNMNRIQPDRRHFIFVVKTNMASL